MLHFGLIMCYQINNSNLTAGIKDICLFIVSGSIVLLEISCVHPVSYMLKPLGFVFARRRMWIHLLLQNRFGGSCIAVWIGKGN